MKTAALKDILYMGALGFLSGLASAQTTPQFDVAAYSQFLSVHRELAAEQLYQMHPMPRMRTTAGYDLSRVAYLDSINRHYELTPDEMALLTEHGFVVSERLSRGSFGHSFLEIYQRDLPVFVSTDALLHALHMSYDAILIDTELGILIPQLKELLSRLHAHWPALTAKYASDARMAPALADVDLYVTMTLQLLGENVAPHRPENLPAIDDLVKLIDAEQPGYFKLFANTDRLIDFSQFHPRGHYTQKEELKKYFRAMIWLGRTEFYLTKPKVQGGPIPTEEDIQRQIIGAFLLLEAAQQSGALQNATQIDEIIRSLVGESDNATLHAMDFFAQEIGLTRADELLQSDRMNAFKSVLVEKSFAVQRILSQILVSDPFNPTQIEPAMAFMLLGQRFVIDSYVMSNVVFDRILHQGIKVWRPMPSSLDVLFALGNDAAPRLLNDELDRYHYAPNATALRYLVDAYEDEFWSSSLYNTWLQAIRTLNPPEQLGQFPGFMQTAAWWQQKMNTQLASWAQLRHDNLLYAKQSYTGVPGCDYPYSLVEPFPQFYATLKDFARNASDYFITVPFADSEIKSKITGYFNSMAGVMDTLTTIADKQLHGAPLVEAETTFLKAMLFDEGVCATVFNGWYPRLFYKETQDCELEDLVVADVHTQPADAAGNLIGRVLHAGTGPVNLGVVIAPMASGELVALVAPFMSYYEHVTMDFKRLTDEEWREVYRQPPSVRPSWTNLYLADAEGKRRQPGVQLPTAVKDHPDNSTQPIAPPQMARLHPNWPNPFNASTLIRFELTASNETPVQLAIYNVRGEIVRELVNQALPSGHYLFRWDGKDQANREVAAGAYLYRLRTGNELQSRKLLLLK